MNIQDLTSALTITGLGLIGIFIFMIIFYFLIKAIDKVFPEK
ncbi:MAG TPA: OadG-related small transporter subunit [Bacteroidales bacterium]|jgi:Na+-transporting methylmalonyl-CoA/oxaloacetate decarboxylase gamma subunit|nr:OadG-related small transporter subunit [Bacteroidales bacterium]HON21444.1 OadG-related small transporter subunit [Bacteroidales bacterium]HOR81593.1 OadG-related small transporter subunit [Bacteroidales bacterium]HPJ90331.1 OadG-related small transporter subunit [Bacteroidales bacterium]HPX59149.1 OadG-related small transporter subunit [Bacteroidales bacterium]